MSIVFPFNQTLTMVSNLVRSDWKSSLDRNRIINQFLFRLYLPRVEVIIFVAAQNDAGFEDVRTSCWHRVQQIYGAIKKEVFWFFPSSLLPSFRQSKFIVFDEIFRHISHSHSWTWTALTFPETFFTHDESYRYQFNIIEWLFAF